MPGKKNEALRQLDAPSALGDSALENLRLANGPKAILLALWPRWRKYWHEIKSEPVLNEIAELLDERRSARFRSRSCRSRSNWPSPATNFLSRPDAPSRRVPWGITALTPQASPALSNLLDALPGSRQPKLLEALRVGLPDAWPALFLGLLPRANGRVAEVITEAFQAAGREAEVLAAVNRYIRERNITCDFLFWLCKNRPEIYGQLIEPQLFMAILSVLEKDQFSEIKKGTKLYELVLGDKPLIAAILKDAPVPDVRDITRAILLSPVFEELDKRSLLAAIIKLYPEVQAMVVGTDKTAARKQRSSSPGPASSAARPSSRKSSRRKIPQNSKDIGIARGYGDLKENHEFKSAREMQGILTARKPSWSSTFPAPRRPTSPVRTPRRFRSARR